MPTVLFGYKLWSFNKTEHKFQVFGNSENIAFGYKEHDVSK